MNQHMKGQKQLLAFLSMSLALQMLPGSVLQVLANDHGDDVQKQKDHAQTLDDTTYEAVREYWRTELLGDTEGLSEDGDLQTVIEQLDAKAQHYLDTMLPTSGDHLWDDQAYNDAEMGAKATETLDRLKMIAIQINEPMSSLYQDETAKTKVLEGLRFVLDKKYGPDTVKGSSNWWDWEIGAPKAMVDIAILLYDDLDAETIADVTATIDRFVPKADYRLNSSLKETGANLIDKVAIVIKRAALDGNEERLAHAKECMAPLFAYSSSGDGYYPDGSFIRHGNIPYNGSYGYVLLNELTNCIILLSYTDYVIDEEDIQFYENTLLNHYLPFLSYGGNMVDSVRGRAVSRKAQQGDTMGMQTMGVLLQYADTEASEETKEAIYSSLKPIAEQKFADEEQSEDFSLLAYANYIRVKNLAQAEELLANYDSSEAFATPEQYETLRAALEGALEDARTLMDKGNAFTQEELREVTIALEEAISFVQTQLSAHAQYTLAPGYMGGEGDLVETFLFERHRGYCQHFASAATLMFRLCGIPARYVNGYRAEVSDFHRESDTYVAVLQESDQHAWTEVYTPEYGWIPIEVTPSAARSLPSQPLFSALSVPDVHLPVLGAVLVAVLGIVYALHRTHRRDASRSLAAQMDAVAVMLSALRRETTPASDPAFAQMLCQMLPALDRKQIETLLAIVEQAAFGHTPPAAASLSWAKEEVVHLQKLLWERLSWPKRLRICFQIRKKNQKKNGGSHKRATVVFVIGEAGAAAG